jgi:pimeloyl-ACP methyl ester carboxylesterase
MDRLAFDDVELTFDLHEGGERVVLVHACAFVSWYGPVVERLDGAGFSTLTCRRRLRERDGGGYRPLTAAEDASICAQLMRHVGWPTAHVVGHSYGALVAIEMAMAMPAEVDSVALLEPAARGLSDAEKIAAALGPVAEAYASGDREGAVDGFLRHVCGDSYRAVLDRVLPGAFGEAVDASDLFFQAEMPAVQQWSFGADDARRITRPVLIGRGTATAQRFVDTGERLQSWMPEADLLLVPDAGHLLLVENPTALAQGLGEFFARHRAGPAVAISRSTPP